MERVTVICDRCGHEIHGLVHRNDEGETLWTAGYYGMTGLWKPYANEGERIVCDNCMWEDERYLADYPHMRHRID